MKTAFSGTKLVLAAALAAASAGCDRLFDKGTRQDIEAGERKVKAGDAEGAVPLFEAALDGSSKSAEVHYRLALLYAEKLKSPVDALHHFGRYLVLAPEGPHAAEAKKFKGEAERKVVAEFTRDNAITQTEALRLKNTNLKLGNDLAKAEQDRKAAVAAASTNTKLSEGQRKPIPDGARTYIVQPGDTFAKIAIKFYNNKANAKRIQDANFLPQAGTPIIKPGMVLVIP